jgi:hypothetical protein
VWGWHSHSQNGDFGVLWDSRNFRVLWDSWNFRVPLQGPKHLALKRYLYHWKDIKV